MCHWLRQCFPWGHSSNGHKHWQSQWHTGVRAFRCVPQRGGCHCWLVQQCESPSCLPGSRASQHRRSGSTRQERPCAVGGLRCPGLLTTQDDSTLKKCATGSARVSPGATVAMDTNTGKASGTRELRHSRDVQSWQENRGGAGLAHKKTPRKIRGA